MASKRQTVDYPKPKLIAYLRKLADSGREWKEMQAEILPGITCVGKLYDLPPDAPANAPRHAFEGSSMNRVEIRHALRDICRSLAMLDEVSNERMSESWRERARAQAEYDEYFNERTRWGKYYDLRQGIEKLKSASNRVAKIAVLDAERRRLALVRDSASNRFSLLEDKRFSLDQTRLRYPGSFPEVSQWTRPDQPDPTDTRKMIEVAIDECDFSSIVFDDPEGFYVEHISGRMLGSTQFGPLVFRLPEAARQYAEDDPCLSISRSALLPDRVRSTCLWFSKRHKFVTEKPAEAYWLYERYPTLLDTQPPDDGDFTEALETATATTEEW